MAGVNKRTTLGDSMLPILIVDDSREDALLAQRVLAHCKIQNPLTIVSNGAACLDFFLGNPPFQDRSLPCLVLLDMVMAPMTGVQVLTELAKFTEARESVIVMLSGLPEWPAIHAGYQLGAQTFLVKPLVADDVLQMLSGIRALAVHEVPNGYEIIISQQFQSANRGANTDTVKARR